MPEQDEFDFEEYYAWLEAERDREIDDAILDYIANKDKEPTIYIGGEWYEYNYYIENIGGYWA